MNNLSRNSSSFTLALTLALGSATVLAKGPGAKLAQDVSTVQVRCSTTAGSTGATAKSPQPNPSYSCAPVTSGQSRAPTGATTAKTPSRADGYLLSRELADDIPAGEGCTGKC